MHVNTKITAVHREALDTRNKEAGNRIFLTPMTGGIVETDRMIRFLGELSIQQIELVFSLVRGETLSRYATRKKQAARRRPSSLKRSFA